MRVDNPDIPMNAATQSYERYKVRVGNGHQAIIPFLESPTKHPQFDTGTNTGQDAPWSLDEAQCICSRNAHQNADMPEESDARVSYCLVHGCKLVKWTEHEKDGFLLGLYVFGKDFVKLRRFVEGKDLGDLLNYYYGSFWRSEKHIEWSKVRKSKKYCSLGSKLSKGGKGILGEKVFSPSKRMMLISHLVQRASDECQISLLQVGKMYATNNAKVDEFFFAVKSIVGLEILIEAVGIGHGEGALTIPASSTATRRSARRRTMSEKAMSSTITEAFFINRKRPVVQAPSELLVADQQARNNYQNQSSQELIPGSKLVLPSSPGEVISLAEADEKNDQEMSHKSSDHTSPKTILARNSSTESTITASRRSTRSRSMTARALYAVADGFLDYSSPNKKRHGHPL